LIDLQMPGMNGLEATSVLRRRYPDTHVILVTMHDTPELRQASLEGGACGFVAKSRLGQDLPAVLEQVVAAKH
jgi:two-component system, NarL family, nitrate/nitrite response regulator NarL